MTVNGWGEDISGICGIYWGSHGCDLEPDHPGQHRCKSCCPDDLKHQAAHDQAEGSEYGADGCAGTWPYYGRAAMSGPQEEAPLSFFRLDHGAHDFVYLPDEFLAMELRRPDVVMVGRTVVLGNTARVYPELVGTILEGMPDAVRREARTRGLRILAEPVELRRFWVRWELTRDDDGPLTRAVECDEADAAELRITWEAPARPRWSTKAPE